jgi:hypothetical protein
MTEKKSPAKQERIWALRDRSVVPINRTRAHTMRAEPTEAERKLWWNLRHRLPLNGSHFRRQVHLGRYIVDFASHGLKLIIAVNMPNKKGVTQRGRNSWSPRAIGYCVSGAMTCLATSMAYLK